MRTPMFALMLLCVWMRAGEAAAAPRFEVRAARVTADSPSTGVPGGARFAGAARISMLAMPPDPHARFQVIAHVRAPKAACGAAGNGMFADGFE